MARNNCILHCIKACKNHTLTLGDIMELTQISEKIKALMHDTTDIVDRIITTKSNQEVLIMWIENVVDQALLAQNVINPIQKLDTTSQLFEKIKNNAISFGKISEPKELNMLEQSLLNGFCAVICSESEFLVAECAKWIVRIPAEPPTSAVIEGPREGFVEDIITNLSLLRRHLRTKNLKIDGLNLGEETNSQIKIAYLTNIAKPEIVEKVKKKLEKIEIDGVIDSHYLAEYLSGSKHNVFKRIGSTEKPDVVVAKLLEGRIALLVDGSPIVLTVPYILLEDLQSSNDYYTTPARATTLRYLRLFALVIAILLPGIYVALLTYHLKTIPIKLLITITNSIQGLPLPPFLEVLFIIFLFEVLYEASLRMPRYVGLALSVVGALILGDTAVQAGLVSPPAVLIVAITGVMSYTLPEQSSQISLLRLIFTLLGGMFGIFAIVLGGIFLIGYLSSIESFGSPYLAPFSPYIKSDQKDGLTRKNISQMKNRPKSIPNINKRR